jgi:CheY-like chemotaxis protein
MANVLVIDDDPGIRDLLEGALADRQHHVISAANGRDGVQLCSAHPPDLVITDIMLPEQDGLEILVYLRGTNPHLPVIAISGAAPEWNYLQIARKLGARATLQKPFRIDALQQLVDVLLPN